MSDSTSTPAAPSRERHGDPTSLSQGISTDSAMLRIPIEIWLQILGDKFDFNDLIPLRSASKSLWALAERLTPTFARQLHPAHADDPRISDPFFAEALIAAHRLNVASPFEIMLARDGSIAQASSASKVNVGSGGEKGGASASTQVIVSLPSRADWIIGSRRLLHTAHVQGRQWMFKVCETCKIGTCSQCFKPAGALEPPVLTWWYEPPERVAASTSFSNAIFASDALFCGGCLSLGGEWYRGLVPEGTDLKNCSSPDEADYHALQLHDVLPEALREVISSDELRSLAQVHLEAHLQLAESMYSRERDSKHSCWNCGRVERHRCDTSRTSASVRTVYSGLQGRRLATEHHILRRLREDEVTVKLWRKALDEADQLPSSEPTNAATGRKRTSSSRQNKVTTETAVAAKRQKTNDQRAAQPAARQPRTKPVLRN